MNLHEYQAKELLRKFDLPIPSGKFFQNNLKDIDLGVDFLKGPPWVVKSQIHAGGRGAGYFASSVNNKGGVQIAYTKDEVKYLTNAMLNNNLITKQTGEKGKKVSRIYVEEICDIHREYYLSFLIDRKTSQLMLMISASGGIDIESVAEKNPEKIHKIFFSDFDSFDIPNELEKLLNFNQNQFCQFKIIIEKLGRAFISLDASTIEINPLVINKSGNLLLLDAKIALDDNALFRHPEYLQLRDTSEENEMELEASKNDMNYIKLDGEIGCMVNGAGLAMATMDIVKQFGKEPANFLDLGGTANKERTTKGFKIIQSDPNVKSVLINIFGGIIHCDMIANGIIDAIKELNYKLPVVVRFQGTNASEGKNIINKSSLGLVSIDDLTEAAKKVVDLASK